MDKVLKKPKTSQGASIRQRLKSLSSQRGRPFDEILRYYAMERFLYRLSMSQHAKKFFLKGGLMLKVWDPKSHRATMDIDLLGRTSNQIDHLRNVIEEVSEIKCEEDAVIFDTNKLILRSTQTTGDYKGIRCSFFAKLITTRVPILIDIGFNDVVIPRPGKIRYPTLLKMPEPILLGYTMETVFAQKLESIVKLGSINTRMKDFYDLWRMVERHEIKLNRLKKAVGAIFLNRGTVFGDPVAFKPGFYNDLETQKRWSSFLTLIGEKPIQFRDVIEDLSKFVATVFEE